VFPGRTGSGQSQGSVPGGGPAYMTLSEMTTLLSSAAVDRELRDLMSVDMYSKWWAPHTGVVRWAQR